ncbi:sulfurtransferase-like selenium metabolism protein YedF [Phorcysia thermohydrogeniphila]|uniref:Selenium metabolism protein YedF n=1 Tax=Phorcysia thermohydrogeniphila TaxID=936138 RepID=A0A4R1G5W9_9BACT|nr:sulfurtransferase-like selenium metabolism protein YedF [Phorcysia thermohydrogeniphila]TCK03347.1 selenium metabolism protein YedF [Phorcysia thermohydrogeniphila]
MEKIVDCRGLACPVPVLKTKEALESIDSGVITVIVDNRASRENVKRFAEKAGCSVTVEEKEGLYYLKITKGEPVAKEGVSKEEERKKNYVVFIASTYVGEDKELGKILIKGFIKTFLNADPLPSKIVLVNTAVKLACRGADEEILGALKELQQKGVEIICCATCLNYYNLLDELEIGVASNAYDVVQSLANADSVVRL